LGGGDDEEVEDYDYDGFDGEEETGLWVKC
jgi:hypothetical protein